MTHPLLTRAAENGTPIIDGDTATLVWEGAEPPLLLSDLHGWDPAHPAEWTAVAPALWSHTMMLAPDTYIEYAYLTGPAEADRTPDPFNSRTTPNGIGQVNHFFYMPGAEATRWRSASAASRAVRSRGMSWSTRRLWSAASGRCGSTSLPRLIPSRWWWSGMAATTTAAAG